MDFFSFLFLSSALKLFFVLLLVVYLRERDGNTQGLRDVAALFKGMKQRSSEASPPSRQVEE